MVYQEIFIGYDKIPPILLGDPTYPLLPFVMKEYPSPQSNEEVIFNNMLRSGRNPVECAFGRLKARWQKLNKIINMQLTFIPEIVYMPVLYFITFVRFRGLMLMMKLLNSRLHMIW
jgi:hypothetical protein